jgi:hypothetical protein
MACGSYYDKRLGNIFIGINTKLFFVPVSAGINSLYHRQLSSLQTVFYQKKKFFKMNGGVLKETRGVE